MSRPSRPVRRLALGTAVALLLAACGGTSGPTPVPATTPGPRPSVTPGQSGGPTASPSGDEVYAAIEDQVVTIRGLDARDDVVPQTIGEPELVKLVTEGFERDNPAGYVESYDELLTHLGLLGPQDDLASLYVELLGSQVIGMYDPDTKAMYMVTRTGGIGPMQKITFAHEYTHALQDQNYDSEAFLAFELDQGDRSIARLSVLEGDAVLLMGLWAQGNLTPQELQAVVSESGDAESQAILDRMPAILREPLVFPYSAGLLFVQTAFMGNGGWAGVDRIYENPPASTEQILHPDKYTAGDAPVAITIADGVAAALGTGWSETLQDTLGEFQLSVWLRELSGDDGDATDAAAGWGGDRLALYDGPDGAWAVVVETAWDTEDDQAQFVNVAQTMLDKLGAGDAAADVLTRDGSTASVVIASDPTVLGRLANGLGLAG